KRNATFVSLVRDSDISGILQSIEQVEKRFNSIYHYDWVFLNDGDFSEEFREKVQKACSGNVYFGKVPREHWGYPDFIDQDKAAAVREQMKNDNIIYGDSESYRHMCRFESGFFYRQELMLNYKYYWRVEPDIKLYCNIPYDTFAFMEDNDKQYGFTISLHEYETTIKTLWKTTKEFIQENPDTVNKNGLMQWVTEDGSRYNMCHFWSNFEIADMDFWRSDTYSAYFDYLDKSGGFFYERWGDAPVHSIAVALFMDKNKVHHFDDIGYWHIPFNNCPLVNTLRNERQCDCAPADSLLLSGWSCTKEFYKIVGYSVP
ncbi:glycosyltransferase family 15 protein, partial [Tortispora caseinolytica NRRL Y-17796]